MSAIVHPISKNPRLRIRRLVALLVERQKQQQEARAFLEAREHTLSPSDRIAYALDARMLLHPGQPVSTNDDYPGWKPGGAS
jgi:hypothetical protein